MVSNPAELGGRKTTISSVQAGEIASKNMTFYRLNFASHGFAHIIMITMTTLKDEEDDDVCTL